MSKVLACAIREFRTTAMTKAFIFGMLAFPLLAMGAIFIITSTNLLKAEKPALTGTIHVIDATNDQAILSGLEQFFSEQGQRAFRGEQKAEVEAAIEKANIAPTEQQKKDIETKLPVETFDVRLVEINPSEADLEEQKRFVLEADGPLMVINVDQSVLDDPDNARFGLYHRQDIDSKKLGIIRERIQRLVVDERMRQANMDPALVQKLRQWPKAEVTTVTTAGESETSEVLSELMPMIFFLLMYMAVMIGGQYLLMSTIEEKSSRVMEVLLSGISPMQLLIGKIIGQGCVGLFVMAMYLALGLVSAVRFNVFDQIPVHLFWYLGMYFVMGYFMFAAMYAAIGAAVTEIREAQSLMGPVMILVMIPWLLWFPISQNPNSMFARVASFFPPMTPFVMTLRLCQPSAHVPAWEIAAATLVGFLGVLGMIWAAAKIFRIGVLMYGKPPTFMGLLKWLRYA